MKYLTAILISLVTLLIGMGRAEGHMPWRAAMRILPNSDSKEWNKSDRRQYRKKEYKTLLVFWAIFTVGTFVYFVFFVDWK